MQSDQDSVEPITPLTPIRQNLSILTYMIFEIGVVPFWVVVKGFSDHRQQLFITRSDRKWHVNGKKNTKLDELPVTYKMQNFSSIF